MSLALLDSSPYREKQGPPHPSIADIVVAGPVNYTCRLGWFYREDRADFEALLDALPPGDGGGAGGAGQNPGCLRVLWLQSESPIETAVRP